MSEIRLKHITAEAGARIGARLLDIVIMIIVLIPLFVWIFNQSSSVTLDNYAEKQASMTVVVTVFAMSANVLFELIIPTLTKGKTLGKAAVGIRMISDDGDYISFGQIFMRSFFYIVVPLVSLIPLIGGLAELVSFVVFIVSLVFLFTDPYNQAVYDKMGNSYVVYDDRYMAYRAQKESDTTTTIESDSYFS